MTADWGSQASTTNVSDFVARFAPEFQTVLWLIPIAVATAIVFASFASWLATSKGIRTAYTRKFFHFGIFTAAGLIHLVWGLHGVVVFGSVVSIIVLYTVYRGDGFPFYEALARTSDQPHRALFIIVPLLSTAVGGGLTNSFFPEFAFVGYFVGGWGDAAGEPVGTRWGQHRYRVPSLMGVPVTRSVEGSTAVLVTSTLAAVLALWLGEFGVAFALIAGTACGIVATIAEGITFHGLDNFTVQLTAAAMATLMAARI